MPSPRILLVALLALAATLIAAGPATAAAADKVFTLDPLTDKLRFKPAKLSFSDRDMTELRWSRWGKPVARARGIARILACEPSCGAGGADTTATTVKLSRIRERNGKRVYTCMSWRDDEKVTDLPASNALNPFNFRPCKAPGANASAAARAAKRCRGIDMGFTTAKVRATRMPCRRARFVILEWKRKAGKSDGPPPSTLTALGFDCHFGGTDALLKLHCMRGGKVAKATWGG